MTGSTLVLGALLTASPAPTVIPEPVSLHLRGGPSFVFSRTTSLENDGKSAAPAFLKEMLSRSAGISLGGKSRSNRVVFKLVTLGGQLPPNWYSLKVTQHEVLVQYAEETGAFYAVQTLRQLLPKEIDSPIRVSGVQWSVPQVEIEDYPRFQWRGMMLDCSRHFFPVSFIKKTLDNCAMMKLNVFHWHLVDDGGWRLEIKKYPNLTKFGAWRVDTGEVWPGGGWNFGNLQFCGEDGAKKYGGYYTQDQVKDIVRYAAARHITIVPEIEMPGHSLGAVVSYPEIMCENVPPADKPGKSVSNVYCAGSDKAIAFLEEVLSETMQLFPSKFIHIGADEVTKTYWHNCPLCQDRMKKEGLKDENELQSWFVKHFDNFLAQHGRRLVGWDEILEGGLAPGATVMSWRGIDGGIEAAKQGKDVVMSPTSHCYFDYSYQSISTEHVYGWNPVPAALNATEAKHVLGGQYNVWTEWIPTESHCEEMQFPRALAMAEDLWTPPARKDWSDFSRRLAAWLPRLDELGITYMMPVPTVPFTTLFFSGSVQVKCNAPTGLSQTLRYTTDGTVPNSASKAYTGPLTVKKPCTVTFAYVNSHGVAGGVAKVDCRNSLRTELPSLDSGVTVQQYLLTGEPSTIPDLTNMKPTATTVAPLPTEGARPRDAKFAVRWSGYIRIPTAGAYTFSLKSDDGSRLWLGDALVVDNDGPHGAVEKSGTAWLPAGLYPFDVRWFDQGGANSFSVSVAGPGQAKGPIPAKWLFHYSG